MQRIAKENLVSCVSEDVQVIQILSIQGAVYCKEAMVHKPFP
jgi:hypothetical protein